MEIKEEEKRTGIITELEKNVFVEAGAGAGKTTLIVNRIMNQIRSGQYTADQIVVITFTNKAAEELKERITSKLSEEQKQAGSEVEKARLSEAFRQIDRMTISTIHSFCVKLLSERALDAGLRMDVQMKEEAEAYEEKEKLFREWFAGQEASWHQGFRKLEYGYRDMIFKAYKAICELPENTDFPLPDISGKSHDTIWGSVRKQIDQDCTDPDGIFYQWLELSEVQKKEKKASELVEIAYGEQKILMKKMYSLLKEYLASQKDISDMIALGKGYLANADQAFQKPRGKNKEDKKNDAWRKHLKDTNLIKDLEKAEYEWNTYLYARYMSAAVEAREYYRKNRDRRYYTNNLLLQQANDLVHASSQARIFFAGKYRMYYVDEFQDTDEVQASMIWKLCEKEEPGQKGSLRDGCLFLVGDPKQAIYRFRGGDVTVYTEYKDRMALQQNAQVYELQNNYRSNDRIIRWVNEQFQNKLSGYQPMQEVKIFSPVEKGKKSPLGGVFHYPETAPAPEESLAGLIHDLVEKKYQIQVTEEEKDENGKVQYKRTVRDIRYKDFLVLAWNTSKMEGYLNVLKRKQIPVNLSGKYVLKENMPVRNFLLLYKSLAYPYDKVARAGARQVLLQEHLTEENDQEGMRRLRWLKKFTNGLGGRELAYALLEKKELVLPAGDGSEPVRETEMLSVEKKLIQMVETVLSETGDNRQEIADALYRYAGTEQERELALSSQEDCIRFMNVHKAKGLEGNIVIILRNDMEIRRQRNPYRDRKSERTDYYGVVSRGRYAKPVSPFDEWRAVREQAQVTAWKNISNKEELASWEDKQRLEYVAVTRAIEALIVMPVQGKKDKEKGEKEAFPCLSETAPSFKNPVTGKAIEAAYSFSVKADNTVKENDGTDRKAADEKDYDRNAVNILSNTLCMEGEEGQAAAVPEKAGGDGQAAAVLEKEGKDGQAAAVLGNMAEGEQEDDDQENTEEPAKCINLLDKWKDILCETQENVSEQPVYTKLSPSSLERSVHAGSGEDVPKGRIYGLIMHRVMELVVGNRDQTVFARENREENIGHYLEQALDEFRDDDQKEHIFSRKNQRTGEEGTDSQEKLTAPLGILTRLTGKQEEDIERSELKHFVEEFLQDKTICGELENAENVYTELPFSYFMERKKDKDFFEDEIIQKVLHDCKVHIGNEPVWFNGTADLIIARKGGSYLVVDYKSDTVKIDFQKKYEGQLRAYQYAVSRLFGVCVDQVDTWLYTRDGIVEISHPGGKTV